MCLCCDCPQFYFNHKDEEYKCEIKSKIICYGSDLIEYTKKKQEWSDSQNGLFPMTKEEHPKNPYEIPEWCPLPNYQRDDLK